MPLYVIIIFLSFLASIAGLVVVQENRTLILYCFPFFLLLSVMVEYTGSRMSRLNENTINLYNWFTFFEFVFYQFFFWFITPGKKFKRLALFCGIGYIVVDIVNMLFIQGPDAFHSYTYVLGCLLVALLSLQYFYTLFRVPETTSLTRNTYFWIVCGLMFNYTCTIALYGLENFITAKMKFYTPLLLKISDFLNIILYSLFIIGFICRISPRKLYRS